MSSVTVFAPLSTFIQLGTVIGPCAAGAAGAAGAAAVEDGAAAAVAVLPASLPDVAVLGLFCAAFSPPQATSAAVAIASTLCTNLMWSLRSRLQLPASVPYVLRAQSVLGAANGGKHGRVTGRIDRLWRRAGRVE